MFKKKFQTVGLFEKKSSTLGATSANSQHQLHLSHKTDTFTRIEWMISLKGTPQVLEKTLEYFGTLPNEKVKIGSGRKSPFSNFVWPASRKYFITY